MASRAQQQRSAEFLELRGAIGEVKDALAVIMNSVLTPRQASEELPKIAKPIRGVDYNRTINPVMWMREKIDIHNQNATGKTYQQFDDANDHSVAVNAKIIIGRLLRDKLGEHYGKLTWAQACAKRSCRDKCEQVVREACTIQELLPFTYGYDGWAIRMLCEAKMKSARRTSTVKETFQEQPISISVDRTGANSLAMSSGQNGDQNQNNENGEVREAQENANGEVLQARNTDGQPQNQVGEEAEYENLTREVRGRILRSDDSINVPNRPEARIASVSFGPIDDDTPLANFILRTGSVSDEINRSNAQPVQNRNEVPESRHMPNRSLNTEVARVLGGSLVRVEKNYSLPPRSQTPGTHSNNGNSTGRNIGQCNAPLSSATNRGRGRGQGRGRGRGLVHGRSRGSGHLRGGGRGSQNHSGSRQSPRRKRRCTQAARIISEYETDG